MESPAKPKIKKRQSDGAYLGGRDHGVTSKFQAKWLQQTPPEGHPERRHWLGDGGEAADGLFMVTCSFCQSSSSI